MTVKYKDGGKTRQTSAVMTVKKFPNAIKSIKLNGKKLAVPTAKKLSNVQRIYNFSGKSVKVSVTLAKGWKIESMYGSRFAEGAMEEDENFNLKNGKAFKLPKSKSAGVEFTITRDTADGVERFSYNLSVSRQTPSYSEKPSRRTAWFTSAIR